MEITVAVLQRTDGTDTPDDPNRASPEGGFAITTIEGKVIP